MNKIILSKINNIYLWLLRWMWKWDKNFFKDFFPALLQHKTTTMMKLSLNTKKNKKEIWIRNSYFLSKESFAWFPLKVEKKCFSILWEITNDDYICVDEVDIAKPRSKKIEWISKIFDSSEKKTVNWFLFHWISIRWIPVIMEQEDLINKTKNEYFWKIITRLLKYTKRKWTIVLDAWYDIKTYMKFLLEKDTNFIVRAKRERWLYDKKWNKIQKMKSFNEGIHEVYLKQDDNTLTKVYFYVKHFSWYNDPMRIYSDTDNKNILEYKKRWDIECIFKTMKQEYKLEKVQSKSLQVLQNIIATVQMAVAFANDMYGIKINNKWRKFFQRGLALKNRFKKYTKWQWYTQNRNSYIWFISYVIQRMYRNKKKVRKNNFIPKPLIKLQISLF